MIVENSLLFLGTLLASGVMTFVVRGIMRRAGIMDVPTGDRKTHGRPVAYEGGLAMYTAFVCGLVGLAVGVPEFYPESLQFRGLIYGGTFVVLVGVADDLLDLKPWVKLVAQVAAAYIMYHHGFRIEKVSNPLGTEIDFAAFASLAVTVIWYVILMNGINMVDGLDGLAAGIVGISSLTVAAIAMDLNQPFGLALALITAAVCLGFLPFNLSPATIFMGDAGSLLLGFLLASMTLVSSTKAPAVLALLVPMLAAGLPIFETVFAFARRALHGQHPFRGDRRHLHHRFLALGLTPKRTVLIFYYITALMGVSAYVLQRLDARATLALVVIILIGMVFLVENLRFLEKRGE